MVKCERLIVDRLVKFIVGFCAMAAVVAVGVFGTRALIEGIDEASAGEDQGRQPIRVGLAAPKMRTIEEDLSAVGTLRPVRAVQIVPNVAGRVTDVPVTSGQKVLEGDLLIQLDDRSARASMAEAEATLSVAEQEYRRYQQLEDSNAAAEARLEETRGAFRRAQAAQMMAQASLEDRAIIAPFAGTLGVVDIEPGSYLDGSQAVTRLADLSAVEVSVSLSERYFDQVALGQTLEITTPAYPGNSFEGLVTLRATEIDLGTRSFEIRAEIDNADGRLVGGMFANSRLVLDIYEGMTIPDDAIISEGLATYVYTIVDGAAERTEVEIGASLGKLTEVRNGLDMEDRIVVAGWDQITDGAPVEVDEDFTQEGLE